MTDYYTCRTCNGNVLYCECAVEAQPPEPRRMVKASALAEVVKVLRENKQGWENAIEFGLLPTQHHETARELIEKIRSALAAL